MRRLMVELAIAQAGTKGSKGSAGSWRPACATGERQVCARRAARRRGAPSPLPPCRSREGTTHKYFPVPMVGAGFSGG